MAKLASQAVTSLKERIDAVTADPEGIPGVVYCAVNKDGDLLFEHASGKVGVGQERNIDMDTVFWIASCTKMITGIACMQLVEQGKLELDSVELVEKIAPVSHCRVHSSRCDAHADPLMQELKEVKVLEEGGELVEKKQGITLRMLLSHTGRVPSFFSELSSHTNTFLNSRLWVQFFQQKAKRLLWRGRIGRTLWYVGRLPFSTLGQPARRPVGVWHQYRLGGTIGRESNRHVIERLLSQVYLRAYGLEEHHNVSDHRDEKRSCISQRAKFRRQIEAPRRRPPPSATDTSVKTRRHKINF
jgi:Beta-lactamase